MSITNTKLITDTIISHIYHQDLTLTSTQKRALAILINCGYKGCCGSKHETNIDYLLISELMDLIKCDEYFEYANCDNKYCIHIINVFGIITKILPYYPYDESDFNDDYTFINILRYANSTPKYIYEEIMNDIMNQSDE